MHAGHYYRMGASKRYLQDCIIGVRASTCAREAMRRRQQDKARTMSIVRGIGARAVPGSQAPAQQRLIAVGQRVRARINCSG